MKNLTGKTSELVRAYFVNRFYAISKPPERRVLACLVLILIKGVQQLLMNMVPSIKDNGKFEGIIADIASKISHINVTHGTLILMSFTALNSMILLSILADFFMYHCSIKADAKKRLTSFAKSPPSLQIQPNFATVFISTIFSVYEFAFFLPSQLISAISEGYLPIKIINSVFTITISKRYSLPSLMTQYFVIGLIEQTDFEVLYNSPNALAKRPSNLSWFRLVSEVVSAGVFAVTNNFMNIAIFNASYHFIETLRQMRCLPFLNNTIQVAVNVSHSINSLFGFILNVVINGFSVSLAAFVLAPFASLIAVTLHQRRRHNIITNTMQWSSRRTKHNQCIDSLHVDYTLRYFSMNALRLNLDSIEQMEIDTIVAMHERKCNRNPECFCQSIDTTIHENAEEGRIRRIHETRKRFLEDFTLDLYRQSFQKDSSQSNEPNFNQLSYLSYLIQCFGKQAMATSEIIKTSSAQPSNQPWSLRTKQSLSFLFSFSRSHFELLQKISSRSEFLLSPIQSSDNNNNNNSNSTTDRPNHQMKEQKNNQIKRDCPPPPPPSISGITGATAAQFCLYDICEFDDYFDYSLILFQQCLQLKCNLLILLGNDFIDLITLENQAMKFRETRLELELTYKRMLSQNSSHPQLISLCHQFEQTIGYDGLLQLPLYKSKKHHNQLTSNPLHRSENLYSSESCVIFISLLKDLGKIKKTSRNFHSVMPIYKHASTFNANVRDLLPTSIASAHERVISDYSNCNDRITECSNFPLQIGQTAAGWAVPYQLKIQFHSIEDSEFGAVAWIRRIHSNFQYLSLRFVQQQQQQSLEQSNCSMSFVVVFEAFFREILDGFVMNYKEIDKLNAAKFFPSSFLHFSPSNSNQTVNVIVVKPNSLEQLRSETALFPQKNESYINDIFRNNAIYSMKCRAFTNRNAILSLSSIEVLEFRKITSIREKKEKLIELASILSLDQHSQYQQQHVNSNQTFFDTQPASTTNERDFYEQPCSIRITSNRPKSFKFSNGNAAVPNLPPLALKNNIQPQTSINTNTNNDPDSDQVTATVPATSAPAGSTPFHQRSKQISSNFQPPPLSPAGHNNPLEPMMSPTGLSEICSDNILIESPKSYEYSQYYQEKLYQQLLSQQQQQNYDTRTHGQEIEVSREISQHMPLVMMNQINMQNNNNSTNTVYNNNSKAYQFNSKVIRRKVEDLDMFDNSNFSGGIGALKSNLKSMSIRSSSYFPKLNKETNDIEEDPEEDFNQNHKILINKQKSNYGKNNKSERNNDLHNNYNDNNQGNIQHPSGKNKANTITKNKQKQELLVQIRSKKQITGLKVINWIGTLALCCIFLINLVTFSVTESFIDMQKFQFHYINWSSKVRVAMSVIISNVNLGYVVQLQVVPVDSATITEFKTLAFNDSRTAISDLNQLVTEFVQGDKSNILVFNNVLNSRFSYEQITYPEQSFYKHTWTPILTSLAYGLLISKASLDRLAAIPRNLDLPAYAVAEENYIPLSYQLLQEQEQAFEDQNMQFDHLKAQILLQLIMVMLVTLIFAVSIIPIYMFIQFQREKTLKLMATFPAKSLNEIRAVTVASNEYIANLISLNRNKHNNITQTNNNNVNNARATAIHTKISSNVFNVNTVTNHNSNCTSDNLKMFSTKICKKLNISQTSSIEKVKFKYLFVALLFFAALQIYSFSIYVFLVSLLQTSVSNRNLMNSVLEISLFIKYGFGQNYMGFFANKTPELLIPKMKNVYDRTEQIRKLIDQYMDHMYDYQDNLKTTNRYQQEIYEGYITTVMEKSPCSIDSNFPEYANTSYGFDKTVCEALMNGILVDGLVSSTKYLFELEKQIIDVILLKDKQLFDEQIANVFAQQSLEDVNSLVNLLCLFLEKTVSFLEDRTIDLFNYITRMNIIVFCCQSFALILTLYFGWHKFYHRVQKQLHDTKNLLDTIDVSLLVDNPYLISYFQTQT